MMYECGERWMEIERGRVLGAGEWGDVDFGFEIAE